MPRNLSFSDQLVCHLDNALRTLTPGTVKAKQTNPSKKITDSELTEEDRKHFSGLMRINHTGEVCAQALYQGQSMTARLETIRNSMVEAAEEELDHLAWCEKRLSQLNSRTSFLNPVFYGLSFTIGAAAGLAGDKWSLGFVAATEDQVSLHLTDHLVQIEDRDLKSKAILQQMLLDEQRHAENAINSGGVHFPRPVKETMTEISKFMTKLVYHI